MASSLRRRRVVNPFFSSIPILLKWSSSFMGLRGISCTSRTGMPLVSSPASISLPSSLGSVGTKSNFGDTTTTFREDFEIGSYSVTFETGKFVPFANGEVIMSMEETNKDYPYRKVKPDEVTKVLSAVAASPVDGGGDGVVGHFLPQLTVDYHGTEFAERFLFGHSFRRKEGARIIDRPIRPLLPANFDHEVQVMARVLSSDEDQDPDVMAANATSAALMLSNIPWGGPIGVVRIGRVWGKFVINPGMDQLNISDLDLVYACTRDKTLMVDVQARECSERDLEQALRFAHHEAVKYLEPQIRLAAKAGKHKKDYKLAMVKESTLKKVKSLAEVPIEAVFIDPNFGQLERGKILDKITQDVRTILEEERDEESLKVLPKMVDTMAREALRSWIIEKGLRVDGRHIDEVRPIYCESGSSPIYIGSSFFSRGNTQVLCTVSQRVPGDNGAKCVGSSSTFGIPIYEYSIPPFSISEIGKQGDQNRGKVEHSNLVEKALLDVLPAEYNFPYTVHVDSEVKNSDGSTSMATICGGSIALMDAGIPLRKHVAGVSVGLVSEIDPTTGMITDYRILTDISSLEEHLGNMELKVAGTREGVTVIQLDIKLAGIPLDIICECLGPALKGRLQILDHMEQEISAPRFHIHDNWNWKIPILGKCNLTSDSIQRLIGPHGAQKRKIERATGARISVSDDGMLTIVAKNETNLYDAEDEIKFILGSETTVGEFYKGVVSSIKDYGALVEFNGGQQGLLPISELSHEQVFQVSDIVTVGQTLKLKCIAHDDIPNTTVLSLKAAGKRVVLEGFPTLLYLSLGRKGK